MNSAHGDKAIIKDVFTYEYNCLETAKNKPEYPQLMNLLSASERLRFCNPAYQRYTVNSPNGGVIRANPIVESDRIGVIPAGNTVLGIIENEEWIKIVSRWGDGYMHASIFISNSQ